MEQWDVIVLGAGAAGLMAGIEAARRGRRVVVIDHAKAAGEKIRISGGGRCNFTNLGVAADRYLSKNPRFALSALKRFTAWDMVGRISGAGIAWHEKEEGQLFCDGPATQVVRLLLDDLAAAGGVLWLDCAVAGVKRGATGWEVQTARGILVAGSVIVATGGKSIPKMGASGFGYRIAEEMGLPLVETRPGLVPLTFATQELAWIAPLAGVSVPARVRPVEGRAFEAAVLFTHRGLSGPAILQVSNYWREGQAVRVTLAPGVDLAAGFRAGKVANGRQAVKTLLTEVVPERLARHLAEGLDGPVSAVPGARLDQLAKGMQDWVLTPVGSEGYRTAEVTLGGVDTDALDGRTMEVKGLPGLYFVGEVVDVTGWLGGYNFQWAWASGWAAGQVA
jgi:hypothetical protein